MLGRTLLISESQFEESGIQRNITNLRLNKTMKDLEVLIGVVLFLA